MLGRVVKHQLPGYRPRSSGLESFIEHRELVRVQLIQDHADLLDLLVAFFNKPAHLFSKKVGVPG